MSKLSKNIPAPMSHSTRRWNDDIGRASSLAPELTVTTGGIAFPPKNFHSLTPVSHRDSGMESVGPNRPLAPRRPPGLGFLQRSHQRVTGENAMQQAAKLR